MRYYFLVKCIFWWVTVSASFWSFINVKQCLHKRLKWRIIFSLYFLLILAHERVLSVCCTFSQWIEHHWLSSISAGLFFHILSAFACKFICTVSLSVNHWTFMQMSFVHGFFCCPVLLTFSVCLPHVCLAF